MNRPYQLFTFYQTASLSCHTLTLVMYALKLNYKFVVEPEINQKQFRPGKHWSIISICTSYANCVNMHGNQPIGQITGKVYSLRRKECLVEHEHTTRAVTRWGGGGGGKYSYIGVLPDEVLLK